MRTEYILRHGSSFTHDKLGEERRALRREVMTQETGIVCTLPPAAISG